jgi:hypothetical protein
MKIFGNSLRERANLWTNSATLIMWILDKRDPSSGPNVSTFHIFSFPSLLSALKFTLPNKFSLFFLYSGKALAFWLFIYPYLLPHRPRRTSEGRPFVYSPTRTKRFSNSLNLLRRSKITIGPLEYLLYNRMGGTIERRSASFITEPWLKTPIVPLLNRIKLYYNCLADFHVIRFRKRF